MIHRIVLELCCVLLLAGCRHGNSHNTTDVADGDEAPLASLLTLVSHDDYTLATIANPWGEGVLRQYALVPRAGQLPDSLPADAVVVRTPVSRSLVFSVVHTSLIKELGCTGAIAGVVDTMFFTDPEIVAATRSGDIADCGSSAAPDVERIIALSPDAVILDTYQSANFGQISRLNVPIIECADYMENTPLGRAEWVKFYGALLGERERADSLFDAVSAAYKALQAEGASVPTGTKRPRVLTETVIGGVWNVPGGNSYMARLLADAGGDYPWSDNDSAGSLNLDINSVLAVAQDADVWLIKSFNIHSRADLLAANALNAEFAAYRTGRVYVCDTSRSRLYERFPFHPEVLLREYRAIFQGQDNELEFYKRLD